MLLLAARLAGSTALDAPQAVDRNFAIHLPLLDRLFGTLYLPDRWPARYGIEGDPVPDHYLGQVVYPFAARR